ncbi:archaeosortase/exosortase family protein [Candidatus Woesearchaeota archaeon]|jgi:exosortase/archaeosortase family protein|nr:archaeosortase/exosortase family protein [Candidatus Woesearchaeota archaeon]
MNLSKYNFFRINYFIFFTSVFMLLPLLFSFLANIFELVIGFNIILHRLHILFFVLLVLFFILNEEELMKLKPKTDLFQLIVFSVSSLILFFLFFVLRYFIHPKSNYDFAWTIFYVSSVLYGLGTITFFCAIFGLNYFKKVFFKYKKTFISLILLIVIYVAIKEFLNLNWVYFSSLVANLTAGMLNLVYGNIATVVPYEQGMGLVAKGFLAGISKDCSGIESSSLFLFLFLVVLLYDDKLKKDWKLFTAFGLALIGDFVLTSFRIFLLTIVAIEIDRQFAINLFHNNIGWILFVVYFLVFYFLLTKYFRKNKNNN